MLGLDRNVILCMNRSHGQFRDEVIGAIYYNPDNAGQRVSLNISNSPSRMVDHGCVGVSFSEAMDHIPAHAYACLHHTPVLQNVEPLSRLSVSAKLMRDKNQ
jgi:hypothetical protein